MATSPRPYKNESSKKINSQDLFERPKNMVRHEVLDGERKERMKRWITLFRRNPAKFINLYFGIKLFPYQVLMIWILQRSNLAYIVASRAAAKTWIIAVWSLTLAVLYPGSKVIVCAKTLKQGGLLISEKLVSLRDTYPNVAREIKSITANANTYEAIFHCGSSIKVVPSSESSRGNRATYIVVEESRLVQKDILEQIIKPFLFSRMPPYRLLPEYRDDDRLREEGIISFITSAGFKSEYWYQNVKSCIKRMAQGDVTANFMALDYLISIYHNIKTPEMIKNEMADNEAVNVQMEYYNIPSGTSGKSYFKPSLFPRTIKRSFYPQKEDTYNVKRNPYDIKKGEGEIRIVSVDIATRANKTNDQTIISCTRLTPMLGHGYQRDLLFMESHKGINTISQAKRIKEIFFDFESDYLVLDLQQAGISVFDALSQVIVNEERGISYPAMTVADFEFIEPKLKDELQNRTLGLGAISVVIPILATQQLNSMIAQSFRSSLQKKMWHFLITDGDAEEFLLKSQKEFINDPNDSNAYAFFLNPYVQTNLFIGECINLDMTNVGGITKLTEKPGCHKDRYTSVSYANWIISYFDRDLLKESEDVDDWSAFMNIMQVY